MKIYIFYTLVLVAVAFAIVDSTPELINKRILEIESAVNQ